MFTLDQTTGSITNALKHLMTDPCPGKLEVAIHSNVSRSTTWLLVRWGRFIFVTLPTQEVGSNDNFKWFELREGETTIYSGKPWACAVTKPVTPEREAVRTTITAALAALRAALRANEETVYAQMQACG